MRQGYDASQPHPEDYKSFEPLSVIGGYIGGATPHVWDRRDWAAVRVARLSPMPIYVAGVGLSGHDGGVNEGNYAVAMLQQLGLTSTVALDIELQPYPDRGWVQGFCDACDAGKVGIIIYGTPRTLQLYTSLNLIAGLWVASWGTNSPVAGDGVIGWQYAEGSRWDLSVWDDNAPFGGFSWQPPGDTG